MNPYSKASTVKQDWSDPEKMLEEIRQSHLRRQELEQAELLPGEELVVELLNQNYARLRQNLPEGSERAKAVESLTRRASADAYAPDFDPAVIDVYFAEGYEGCRIAAFVSLEVRPDPQHLPQVLDAVTSPRSEFEQLHALRAASAMVRTLDAPQKQQLGSTIQKKRKGPAAQRIPKDSDRWAISERILQAL